MSPSGSLKQPAHDPNDYKRGTTGATDRKLVQQSRDLIAKFAQARTETIAERRERLAAEADMPFLTKSLVEDIEEYFQAENEKDAAPLTAQRPSK